MIWVDREAKKLKGRHLPLEWVDDMKTPSGRIHVGSLRGVVIHDLMFKVLKENGINARFTYVFNNMDQMDAVPSYLDQKKWSQYAGMSLNKIPSPKPGFKNFGEFYAQEFISVFNSINCYPEIIWSSDLYESGKMNEVIRLILDNNDKVKEIYKKVAKAERPKDWYPFQVICENCGLVGTTYAYKWDGEFVYYRCQPDQAQWAKGCGHDGKVSPFNGSGKLHWKLDWPAHWKVMGVTVEGSGKDHMSEGGSYDMASAFCREVLNIEPPYAVPYEWFTIGGRKMSSSKGVGSSAQDVAKILPPDVFRFLIVRTPIATHLDFNPYGDTISNLFDDFDRCFNAYFDKLENKIPGSKQGEVLMDFARIMELSTVKPLPTKRFFLPRFRTIVNLLKTGTDISKFFETQKKFPFSDGEKALLEERIAFAKIYLKNYAAKKDLININDKPSGNFKLTGNQKNFLDKLSSRLIEDKPLSREETQNLIFNILKEDKYEPKEVFQAFYKILIGKDFGPKAADLILKLGLEKTVNLLRLFSNQSAEQKENLKTSEDTASVDINKPEIFSINKKLAEKYPSMFIGIAIIKGVTIKKSDPTLDQLVSDFVTSQNQLTTEVLGKYPEIISYRKLYKEMGIDWHSRRPSPEALLRRLALKKGLYKINTCVDAYNLVVMKNRVSAGAFDLDKISFPTVLRYAKVDEEILLIGDNSPTIYSEKEIAYFDRIGGYNIDFNYRDAQRTAVAEKTKSLLINIDGVYDINRHQVEQTLKETVEIVTEFCGGQVELVGIVSAR